MEKVISLLFDIEKKANQIIERANIEKNDLFEENEKAIKAMEDSISEENNAKINQLMAQADQEIEKEKTGLIENSAKQLKELDESLSKNHDSYVNKIFHSIILP